MPAQIDNHPCFEACETSPGVVVIVDPYSSGLFLVQELMKEQVKMVAVQSSDSLSECWKQQLHREYFLDVIEPMELEKQLVKLSKYNVLAVLPGSEPGVMLAEELADVLALPCNGAKTKDWRRHKFAQQERLREVGLRSIKEISSADLEETLEWSRQNYPVVIKPAMSGGMDGVCFCRTDEHVREAYRENLGHVNVNGECNVELLVQEELQGTEYIVDCVSYNGQHVVSGIWKYWKTNPNDAPYTVKRTVEFMESRGEVQDALVEYVKKVLNALGLRFGASHTEVFMTPTGPCLVETGARLHGGEGPKLVEHATGFGTHQLLADTILGAKKFHHRLESRESSGQHYEILNHVFDTYLINPRQQELTVDVDNEILRSLESVAEIYPNLQKGVQMDITHDLQTCPGYVVHVHKDRQQCLDDIKRIEEFEKSKLGFLVTC
jgi:biotin carboxylase